MGKTDHLTTIKNVKKAMQKFRTKLEIQREMVIDEIKEFYNSNREPPQALLVRWKQLENLHKFASNSVYSLDTQVSLAEVGTSLKEAMGGKNTARIAQSVDEIQKTVMGAEEAITSFSDIQTDLMQQNKIFSQTLKSQEKTMEKTVDKEAITREFLQETKMDVNSPLIEIAQKDPEFFEQLDESVKQKIPNMQKTYKPSKEES